MLHFNTPSQCCYYCGSTLKGHFIHAPFRLVSGVFHTWGYFCNFECGRQYNDFYKVERAVMNLYLKRKYKIPLVFLACNPITDLDLDAHMDVKEKFIGCIIQVSLDTDVVAANA